MRYSPIRKGDIPHSLASIEKAEKIWGYKPEFNFEKGLKLAVNWYWKNLKLKTCFIYRTIEELNEII